jgi:protein kinase A
MYLFPAKFWNLLIRLYIAYHSGATFGPKRSLSYIQNVVIGGDGYCFLIDFGFAKIVTDKTYTLCGTPPYLAPEIILSRGYEKGVDNWSFAVLVFHMMFGYSPFYSHGIDKLTLYKRIVTAQYNFPCLAPNKVSEEAKDLISKILVTDNSMRLGSLVGGDDDIRNHPWLAKLSENEMVRKCIEAPGKPKFRFPPKPYNKDDWEFLDTMNRTHKLSSSQQLLFKNF